LQVVAYERGETACLSKELLDQFDWHPAGPGIIDKDGGVCASLTALAALPWQDPAYSRPPVQVVSARDFMRGYSLVVGEWGSSTSANDEAACDGMMADEVCMDVIEDVRLREMLTLSGPRVSSQVPLRLTLHVPPKRGRKLVLLVAPAVKGQPRRATWVTTARTGSSACIERSWFKDNRLVEPIDSRQDGDRICFRV
jgi:hypothetical protein